MDKQAFFNGSVFDAYRWFGAHLEGDTAVFRTFAPNAARITVTGRVQRLGRDRPCSGWPQRLLGGAA